MKISVVTISFNQAEFLKECIQSVLNQAYANFEYIVVDPGSTDGSREIIESYGDRIVKIFEKDNGPADGLNKGFERASGDVFCYLNSDDMFIEGAFLEVVRFFKKNTSVDVLCGHAVVIDRNSNFLRRVYSDRFSIFSAAYGSSVFIQPSTFFRREVYRRVGGFNSINKSNWDSELLIDMALAGAAISIIDKKLSCYRVHGESITGSGRLVDMHTAYKRRMFEKIMGRPFGKYDLFISYCYRLKKHISNPRATIERILHGPIFGTQN